MTIAPRLLASIFGYLIFVVWQCARPDDRGYHEIDRTLSAKRGLVED